MDYIISLAEAINHLTASMIVWGATIILFIWILRELLRDTPIYRLAEIHVELLDAHFEQMQTHENIDSAMDRLESPPPTRSTNLHSERINDRGVHL